MKTIKSISTDDAIIKSNKELLPIMITIEEIMEYDKNICMFTKQYKYKTFTI